MRDTSNIGRTLTIVALAVTSLLWATHAGAEDLRIRVGDVSQADGAHAFNDRLASAARALCAGYSRADLAARDACAASVRRQALAQLTADQRAELATPNHGMAMAQGSH
ncbi:UrcA family protein [Caulobacter sp. KR2-114]|uniref:UrcA family protein n=1 Tax=Caulobacter sp. KR2-114 TaxID=3400912 RepID=UPI003C096198